MFGRIKLSAMVLVLLFCNTIEAQDAAFSQFYANPLFLNPATAGGTECGRLNLNYRNQWPSFTQAFVTYAASFDFAIPSVNSGLGFNVMSDNQADGTYNRTSASVFYSYKLRATENIVVSFGLRGGYYQEQLRWEKLIFADQINPTTGEISASTSETPPPSFNKGVVDFGAGLMMGYLDQWFVGVAADHLTQPDLSLFENSAYALPMKITAHAGAVVNLSQGMMGNYDLDDLMLQPNILYQQQGDFQQLNLGVYLDKAPFVIGAWFRHNFENPDAAIVLVGLNFDNVRFGYSYDFTVSNLGGTTGGAHEISLSWEFCLYKEPGRSRIRAIRAPTF